NLMGAHVQNNEPFSVVSPTNPDLVIAGWNDYCSDWMGLGFSTDGGTTWTDSLVPGYPADTSEEGMASPVFGRANAASDPVGAFDRTGEHFYFGSISYNQFARPGTTSCTSSTTVPPPSRSTTSTRRWWGRDPRRRTSSASSTTRR